MASFPKFVEFFETSKMFHGLRIPSGRWRSSFRKYRVKRFRKKTNIVKTIATRNNRRVAASSCSCSSSFLIGVETRATLKWRRRGRRRRDGG